MTDYNSVGTLFPVLDLDISTQKSRLNCYDIWFHHNFRCENYFNLEREGTYCCGGRFGHKKRLFLLNTTSATWTTLKEVFLGVKAFDGDSNEQLKKTLKHCGYEEMVSQIDYQLFQIQSKMREKTKIDLAIKI